ncbi:MAG: nucleoside monophosphate kinase [Alphaproteobacteria bacterium]|nr:nucleoside monophosphate kinase [Alphaproteobacteria bacterium]
MYILIFGSNDSGKTRTIFGRDGKPGLLHLLPGYQYISVSNYYREKIISGAEIGKSIKAYMEKGRLVPDELTFKAIIDMNLQYNGNYICDGVPRNISQAQWFEQRAEDIVIIKLILPEKIAWERAQKRKRADDTPQAFRRRMKIYNTQTKPAIKYLKEKYPFLAISSHKMEADKRAKVIFEFVKQHQGL